MTRDEFEKTVLEYMDAFTTMTIACSTHDEPWAAAVFYARQGWDLIFFSSPQSRHAEAFSRNPSAAAAIHGDYLRWQDIKGLQLEGRVERVLGTISVASATATYLRRYPFVREFFSDPGVISTDVAAKVAKVALYVFRSESIRYLSNEEGFGRRWKMEIQDGQLVGEPIRD